MASLETQNYDDLKVSALILFMDHEVEVTAKTLAYLADQRTDNLEVALLHNGPPREDLKKRFSGYDWLHYYEAGSNLGVAGGRNYLLDTQQGKEADIIAFVDNDVVLPRDYLRKSVNGLLASPQSGVVGAAVLTYRHFHDAVESYPVAATHFDHEVHHFEVEEIRGHLPVNPGPKWFDHLGVHPNWEAVYLRMDHLRERMLRAVDRKTKKFQALRNEDANLRRAIQQNGLPRLTVSNVPGCTQVFRRSLVDEIGPLDNAFNPYGFEDVDFCIRSIRAGYRNYILVDNLLLHGTDQRHLERKQATRRARTQQNMMRCLTILAHRHTSDDFEDVMWEQMMTRFALDIACGNPALTQLYHYWTGFQRGRTQALSTPSNFPRAPGIPFGGMNSMTTEWQADAFISELRKRCEPVIQNLNPDSFFEEAQAEKDQRISELEEQLTRYRGLLEGYSVVRDTLKNSAPARVLRKSPAWNYLRKTMPKI